MAETLSTTDYAYSDSRWTPARLCARCATIKVGALLDPDLDIGYNGKHIISLGKARTKDFSRDCSLCKILLFTAPPYKRRHCLELRLFDKLPNTSPEWMPTVEDRFLAVTRQNKRLTYDDKTFHEIGSRGLLIPVLPPSKTSSYVKDVDAVVISYGVIKHWLAECAAGHGPPCIGHAHDSLSVKLFVIDCFNRSIVSCTPGTVYVALSYVWGAPVATDAATVPSLPDGTGILAISDDVALTVKDAMEVVRRIGMRYLWVDRYCIPQQASSDRHEAISNMNQIYSGASLTIVALHGENSSAGLPGVSSVSRSGLQQSECSSGAIITTFPPLAGLISQSVWAKRGWTFQEARLSRRCLFFTEHQVYFSCQWNTVSEALPDQSLPSPASSHLNFATLARQSIATSDKRLPWGLFLDRFTYSQRVLSYQADALDAFRGILRLHPYVTLWGVPVTRRDWQIDPSLGFALGLLWIRQPEWSIDSHLVGPSRKSVRRPGFPTWSWASITSFIYQDVRHIQGTFYSTYIDQSLPLSASSRIEIKPRFQVSVSTASGDVIPLSQAVDRAQKAHSNVLPEISPSVFIEGELVKLQITHSSNRRMVHLCDCDGTPISHSTNWLFSDDEPVYDVDDDRSNLSVQLQDALVIVEWHDSIRRSRLNFVLMLLRWRTDRIAERVGLLNNYGVHRPKSLIDSLPRTHMSFELR